MIYFTPQSTNFVFADPIPVTIYETIPINLCFFWYVK